MTKELLLNKGFNLVECKDGWFYVLETKDQNEASRIMKIWEGEHANYAEHVILQCTEDLDDFVIYCDGYDEKPTQEQFNKLVSLL